MSLPGIFQVFRLAIGPSSTFTTGALQIGQAFRGILETGLYRNNHRILVELSGTFHKNRFEYAIEQAVVAGLAGFSMDDPGIGLQAFFSRIKTDGCFHLFGEAWPFNPESDLLTGIPSGKERSEDLIRFHVVSQTGLTVYLAEYGISFNGEVDGPGIHLPSNPPVNQSVDNWSGIKEILFRENIDLIEYISLAECALHRISRDQFQKRMIATWKYMVSLSDRAMKRSGEYIGGTDMKFSAMLEKYLELSAKNPVSLQGLNRAAASSFALAGGILDNHPVITSPTCYGSAILPSVFRHYQEKFLFPDEKIVNGLIVGGLFGSLVLQQFGESKQYRSWRTEVAASAVMAAAGLAAILGMSTHEIEQAATMATQLYCTTNRRSEQFEAKAFLGLNAMIVQTLPALVDLCPVQPAGLTPGFDESLRNLFA